MLPLEPVITPRGELWLATPYHLLRGDSVTGLWTWADLDQISEYIAYDETDVRPMRLIPISSFSMLLVHLAYDSLGQPSQRWVWRSGDKGRSWTPIGYIPNEGEISYEVSESGAVWIGNGDGQLLHVPAGSKRLIQHQSPFRGAITAICYEGAPAFFTGGENRLMIAVDGGDSWMELPTPQDQRAYVPLARLDHHIRRIEIYGDYLLVKQGGKVFYATIDADSIRWRRFPEPGIVEIGRDMATGELYGIDGARRTVRIDSAMNAHIINTNPLLAAPEQLVCNAGRIIVQDVDSLMYEIGGSLFRYALPLHDGKVSISELTSISPSGRFLWGHTSWHIYGSEDGTSWKRLARAPVPLFGIQVIDSNRVLLPGKYGATFIFDRRSGSFDEVTDLRGATVHSICRRNGILMASGSLPLDDTPQTLQRIAMGDPEILDGDDFLAYSLDGGANWKVLDRWLDGLVNAMFIGDGLDMMTVSRSRILRRMEWNGDGYRVVPLTEPIDDEGMNGHRFGVPFYFVDRDKGYLPVYPDVDTNLVIGEDGEPERVELLDGERFSGMITDGGRTWSIAPFETFPFDRVVMCEDIWLGMIDERNDTVFMLRGDSYEPSFILSDHYAAGRSPWLRRVMVSGDTPAISVLALEEYPEGEENGEEGGDNAAGDDAAGDGAAGDDTAGDDTAGDDAAGVNNQPEGDGESGSKGEGDSDSNGDGEADEESEEEIRRAVEEIFIFDREEKRWKRW